MKTKDYITSFNLNHPQGKWDRKKFIKALKEEFLEKIEVTKQARIKSGLDYSYRIFQMQVKEIQDKFWSISNHKGGEPLTKELFNAFYGTVIIPLRGELFPEEDAKIRDFQERKKREEEERYLAKLEGAQSDDWL